MASNPLHQFEIQTLVPLSVGGYDISFTNQSLWMVGAVLFVSMVLMFGSRKPALVPSRMQGVVEVTVDFIRQLTRETAGQKALKFLPFIATLFLFIATMNVVGMIPTSYTATSQLVVTGMMAAAVFVMVIAIGLYEQGFGFFKLFYPQGTPWWLAPLIVTLEVISFCARPITLALRLAANMMAGHILLKIFATFVIMLMAGLPLGVNVVGAAVPLLLSIALTGLEIGVALLQAYIFTILTCVYLHDALYGH